MDIIVQSLNGDISIIADDEEVAAFSDTSDPVQMLATTLTALGYNVDTVEQNTEEETEDFQDEEV